MGAGATVCSDTSDDAPASDIALRTAALLQHIIPGTLSASQHEQLERLETLLSGPGWKNAKSRRGIDVAFKLNDETGLYYTCSACPIDGTLSLPQAMFNDFASGGAQQRYNEVCKEEQQLRSSGLSAMDEILLGPERLVRGIYSMPAPLSQRDFVWWEWSALLVTADSEQLFLSMAQTPDDADVLYPPQEGMVRGKLHLAATIVRQSLGEPAARSASIILGDVRGKMPRPLQNMVAGNVSSYLANFRDAHHHAEAGEVDESGERPAAMAPNQEIM